MLHEVSYKLAQALRRRRFRDYPAPMGLAQLHHLSTIVGHTGATIAFPDRCLTEQQIDLEQLAEVGREIVRLADNALATVNLLLDKEDEEVQHAYPDSASPIDTSDAAA